MMVTAALHEATYLLMSLGWCVRIQALRQRLWRQQSVRHFTANVLLWPYLLSRLVRSQLVVVFFTSEHLQL